MLAVLPYVLHGMFNREISLWYTMLTIFDGINSLLGCSKNQESYVENQFYKMDFSKDVQL